MKPDQLAARNALSLAEAYRALRASDLRPILLDSNDKPLFVGFDGASGTHMTVRGDARRLVIKLAGLVVVVGPPPVVEIDPDGNLPGSFVPASPRFRTSPNELVYLVKHCDHGFEGSAEVSTSVGVFRIRTYNDLAIDLLDVPPSDGQWITPPDQFATRRISAGGWIAQALFKAKQTC